LLKVDRNYSEQQTELVL